MKRKVNEKRRRSRRIIKEIKVQSMSRLVKNFITSDYKGTEYQYESFKEFCKRKGIRLWGGFRKLRQ